jgi:hypothetical protein
MQFRLTINCDNAAVQHPDQLGEIIRSAASQVQSGHGQGNLRDWNGNTVGRFELTED